MIENLTLTKAIELAVITEDLGAGLYRGLAARFSSDKELSEVFSLLARDEDTHRAQFQTLLASLPPEPATLSQDQEHYLRAMASAEFFSGESGFFKDLGAIRTTTDALEKALTLEKATLAYYEALRDVLPDDRALAEVIATEKRHVVQVMRYMITGAKMRGLSDTF